MIFAQHFAAEAWSRLCSHPLGDDLEPSVAAWAGNVEVTHVHEQLWPMADQSLVQLTQDQNLKVVVQVHSGPRTCPVVVQALLSRCVQSFLCALSLIKGS